MQGERERWRELCQQASQEQDPERLIKMAEEIVRLLKQKRKQLEKKANLGKLTFSG